MKRSFFVIHKCLFCVLKVFSDDVQAQRCLQFQDETDFTNANMTRLCFFERVRWKSNAWVATLE